MSTFLWFAHCKTAEEVKLEYRKLCKQYHPDLGTPEERDERTRTMQEINAAYARESAIRQQAEMREKARQYNRPEPSQDDYADAAATDERIRAAIERIITLEGLEIEICGMWVWVGGDTKPHKDALREAQYRWAPQKTKWYFAGIPAGKSRGMDMDSIRARYGSQRVVGNSKQAPKALRRGDE